MPQTEDHTEPTEAECLELDAIKARVNAFTGICIGRSPGNADYVWATFANHLGHFGTPGHSGGSMLKRDAEFIAQAREDVLALIAEVERLRACNAISPKQLEDAANAYAISKGHVNYFSYIPSHGDIKAMRAAFRAAGFIFTRYGKLKQNESRT